MENDKAPKVGEMMGNGGRVLAIHRTATMEDQNEYVVLALIPYSSKFEYATWHLYADDKTYLTVAGEYFSGMADPLMRAVFSFYRRGHMEIPMFVKEMMENA